MNIQDIIRDMEEEPNNFNEIKAAAVKEEEKQTFARGQIRVVKKTNERVTIMAASDSDVEVIFNKSGRKATLKKEDTEDFVR